jgi:hypothetical protein
LLYALSKVAPVVQDFARSDRPPSNIRVSPISPAPPRPALQPDAPQPAGASAGTLPLNSNDSLASTGALPVSPLLGRRALISTGVFALALALLFGGVWLGLQRSRGASTRSVTPAATTQQESKPQPVESVTIELFGLPESAVLMLDGRPASGSRFQLEKDGTKHVLSATAEGFAPWSHTFDASSDLRIEAKLVPEAPVVVEAVQPEPPEATPKPRTPPKPKPPQPTPSRPTRVITELDY